MLRQFRLLTLMLFLELVTVAFAKAETVGKVLVQFQDPRAAASCAVLSERLRYQSVRSYEEAAMIAKIADGHRVTGTEYVDLKRLDARLHSHLSIDSLNSVELQVTWPLGDLSPALQIALRQRFAAAGKTVQIVDEHWHSQDGFLPEDIQLAFVDSPFALRLSFATNAVDTCFGDPEIRVRIDLPDGSSQEFRGRLP